jgi:hypothetical protein
LTDLITEYHPVCPRSAAWRKGNTSRLRYYDTLGQRLVRQSFEVALNGISRGSRRERELKTDALGDRAHLNVVQLRLDLPHRAVELIGGYKSIPAGKGDSRHDAEDRKSDDDLYQRECTLTGPGHGRENTSGRDTMSRKEMEFDFGSDK